MSTKYLNAKNGIEILHSTGTTQILAGIGDPSVFGLNASVGSIFLRTDLGSAKTYTKIDDSLTGWEVTTLSGGYGLTPQQHVALHNDNKFIELHRENSKVVGIDEWFDENKTYHISSSVIVRSNNKVVQIIKSIYDYETGSHIIATVTGTINRVDGKVDSMRYSRDTLIGGY